MNKYILIHFTLIPVVGTVETQKKKKIKNNAVYNYMKSLKQVLILIGI